MGRRHGRAVVRGRSLKALLVLVAASAIAWLAFGFWGWVAVTLTLGFILMSRGVTLYVHGDVRREEDLERLVAVSPRLTPLDAERFCERLESEGIEATYLGRVNAETLMPKNARNLGLSVQLGVVHVAVRQEDAERAMRLLKEEAGHAEIDKPVDPVPAPLDVAARSDAMAAFGEPRRRWFRR